MGWNSYANYAAIGSTVETETSYGHNTERDHITPDAGNPYDNIRERVHASWRWGGINTATAHMLSGIYKSVYQQQAVFPDAGSELYIVGDPVSTDAVVDIVNLRPAPEGEYSIKAGWKFQIWGDETIYTVTGDKALPTATAASTDTTIVTKTGTTNHYGLALDLTNSKIYYVRQTFSPDAITVRRCDLTGANDTLIWSLSASGLQTAFIEVDPVGQYIYVAAWITGQPGGIYIYRVTYAGAGATTLWTHLATTALMDMRIDVANSYIYVAASDGLFRLPIGGGTATSMAASAATCAINATTKGVYYVPYTGANNTTIYHQIGAAEAAAVTTGKILRCLERDATTGNLYGTGLNDDLWKLDKDGNTIFQRVDFLSGTSEPHALRFRPSTGQVYYERQNIYRINQYTASVICNISPALGASSAIKNGAALYFFLTDSCEATRINDANGWETTLRANYRTKWITGPTIE